MRIVSNERAESWPLLLKHLESVWPMFGLNLTDKWTEQIPTRVAGPDDLPRLLLSRARSGLRPAQRGLRASQASDRRNRLSPRRRTQLPRSERAGVAPPRPVGVLASRHERA